MVAKVGDEKFCRVIEYV